MAQTPGRIRGRNSLSPPWLSRTVLLTKTTTLPFEPLSICEQSPVVLPAIQRQAPTSNLRQFALREFERTCAERGVPERHRV